MKNILTAVAQNRVFANLVMVTILMAGILSSFVMIREDMPQMQLDTIVVTVAYPGADPEEVEEGVSRKIEDAVDGLEGIDEYTSTSMEGTSTTRISVKDGFDSDDLLDRVRSEVDAISTFPDDVENPSVISPQIEEAVISLALLSDMPEARLKEWADVVKKEIQNLPGVSQAKVSGTRSYEISVELSQATLLKYNITISEVADIISKSSLNQTGGTIKTDSEEIRLRTIGRKYTGKELAAVKIIKGSDGRNIPLGEIAQINDAFTQNNLSINVNGQPAVLINVLAGDEDTIVIADTVKQYQKELSEMLPSGSEIIILSDNTESTRSNLNTLFSNAVLGLIFVFILLWLFMDTKISFWAGMGIPISLAGGLAIVHFTGISLNKITLFGLIMVLGIVADDAIVVGESIYYHRKNGASPLDAVVKGVMEVGMPVFAAVLTTIVAFLPLYNIDGIMGKFIVALPTAVIACLVVSLIECMVLLPAHLYEVKGRKKSVKNKNRFFMMIDRFHTASVNSMDWVADKIYLPMLKKCIRYRYIFLCFCFFILLICAGLLKGGLIKFNVFPEQAGSIVVGSIEYPDGTPYGVTEKAVNRIEKAARTAADKFKTTSGEPLIVNTLATIGQSAGGTAGKIKKASTNIGGVKVTLIDPEKSGIHSEAFLLAWEKETGAIVGVQTLDFSTSNGGPPGSPIEICIKGNDMENVSAAANKTIAKLKSIEGVSQVFSDNVPGKNELKFNLKKEAEYLGLSISDLATQVYGGFYGAEAVKIQRGNDEVEVNVRFTKEERESRSGIHDLMIKTPAGTYVPLSAVADISYEPGYSTITRKDGTRQVKVSAKVDTSRIVAGDVTGAMEQSFFKTLKSEFPGIKIVLEGDAKRSAKSFSSLYLWIPVSIMGIFMIIATMFRSYAQPLLILFTIPFGLVGAVLGHFIMGHMLSLLSVFGMVALAGVVVNDAIVLIERINMNLAQGMAFFNALIQGGQRRFRAVMLTSISTVGGLFPLIIETSQHAQDLIPMGISLAFGVAFSTMLTLLLLPCLFTITSDIRMFITKLRGLDPWTRESIEPACGRTTQSRSAHGLSYTLIGGK